MIAFDETELLAIFSAMPPFRRTAFAAACAERQIENYKAYFRVTGRGNPNILMDAIASVWNQLLGSSLVRGELEKKMQAALSLLPEEAPFVPEQLYANDAVSSVVYTIKSLLEDNVRNPIWAARHAYEAADNFAMQSVNSIVIDGDVENRIIGHPVVQAELLRQWQNISKLINVDHSNLDEKHVFLLLRQQAQSDAARFLRPMEH